MKRLGKEPSPTDLGLKMLNDRIKVLEELKSLCNTDEFRDIANTVHQFCPGYAEPFIGEKCFYWDPYLVNLNRWTDPRLVDFQTMLNSLSPDDQEVKEYPESYNKDFILTWKFENDFQLQVRIRAYEKSETAECRKVQIGTKMVEQPIYRYDCVTPEGNSGELPPPAPVIDNKLLDDIPF